MEKKRGDKGKAKKAPKVPPAQRLGANWWVASEYIVSDGGFISPADGAHFRQVDVLAEPAVESNKVTTDAKGRPRPYSKLLDELFAGLPAGAGLDTVQAEVRKLGSIRQQAVLDWSSSYGLLGLLPQRAAVISRAQAPRDESPRPKRTDRKECVHIASPSSPRCWFRIGADWTYIKEGVGPNMYAVEWQGPNEQVLVDPREIIEVMEYDGYLENDVAARKMVWRDLPALYEWFPSIKNYYSGPGGPTGRSSGIPHPHSEPFWQLYAEGVDDFVTATAQLYDIREHLVGRQPRWGTPATDVLEGLLATASLAITPHARGQVSSISVRMPSLMAMLAYLMVQDSSAPGFGVVTCESCGSAITLGRGKYCNARCRSRLGQQNFKARRIAGIPLQEGVGRPPKKPAPKRRRRTG